MKNRKGFTLVELLAAVVILGIITAISFPLLKRFSETSENRRFGLYGDSLKDLAKSYVDLSAKEEINYYDYYKEKYCNNISISIKDDLKDKLIEFRKNRSNEMNIPAYYVFTNEELDKLVELRPKTVEELKNANILTAIKIKTHGEEIIKTINK